MKCDELKYERLGDAFNDYPDSTLVIRKQFVDAAIAELKAERKWHRVSDCKPPEETRVLVIINIQGVKSIQIDDYTRDDGFASTRVPRFRIYGPYVTHWMSLPKVTSYEL